MKKLQNKPNIILIVVDALRTDHLSCYGYHRLTTPNLDNFAKESILFQSAFSTSPSTVGSIPSILSGLYPSFHGTGVDGNVLTLSNEISTLPEMLKEEGYTTVGFNTNPYMAGKHGYDKGYVSYFDLFPLKEKRRLPNKGLIYLKRFIRERHLQANEPHVCSKVVNKRVKKWLKNAGKEPFFMWIHYMDTHAPYFPREPYFSKFSSSKSKGQIMSFKKQFNQTFAKLFKDSDLIALEERELLVNCYDSEIRYFDQNFKNLLNLLRKHNLFDNTLIIVTADHGEEFWEHGKWGHYMQLYDVNIHVPLLIRYPHIASERKTVSKQVQNIDIFPTILDIMNIKPRHYLSGVSLLPFINDENSVPERVLLSEGGGVHGISVKCYIDRVYSLRTSQWKYIKNVTKKEKQLYRLGNDPMELKNLINEPYAQNIIKNLDAKLDNLLDSATKFEKTVSPVEIDNQIISRLKALGYM